MWHVFSHRLGHYALLIVAHLLLTMPNLGRHTLWDMDEGVNAGAAREMIESGNWITPYFNYKMRTAKPAMLYWLQATSMLQFGVNEFGARLPSVLCGLGSVLLVYELARKMFSRVTGLLAGIVLASCIEFCLLSHAATPDAPLLLFFMLTMVLYWHGSTDGRQWWYAPVGVSVGLAVLTKGPVGIALPAAIVGLHLLATKQYRAVFSWRVLLLLGAFVLTAGPWYGLVAMDTKGQWIKAFIMKENLDRFNVPQENHRGGVLYHPLLLLVLFAPWSIFLAITFWHAVRNARLPLTEPTADQPSAQRLLLIWFGVVMVVFSVAATKLPNYVLPLYPAVAIMTARVLDRWRTGAIHWPRWLMWSVVITWAFVGVVTMVGILLASGMIELNMKGFRPMPAIGPYAWVGVFPILSAILFAMMRHQRSWAMGSLTVGAVLYLASIAAFPTVAMNDYKAPQPLVERFRLNNPNVELRLGGFHWIRQSVVFYAERELVKLDTMPQANAFLGLDRPTFVFVSAKVWPAMQEQLTVPHVVLGQQYDLYAGCDIMLIANPAGISYVKQLEQ